MTTFYCLIDDVCYTTITADTSDAGREQFDAYISAHALESGHIELIPETDYIPF